MKIYCKNIHEYIDIEGGETLQEIATTLAPRLVGLEPICAAVNNKTEPLQYQLFGPKQVEFLPRESASGTRVYVRSLSMMLYCAVRQEMPSTRLRIEHSLAGGYYCLLFEEQKLADGTTSLQAIPSERIPAIVERLRTRMRELCQRDIPFERKERLTADIIEKFREAGLTDKVTLLQTIRELYTTYYRLDGVVDSYYGALAPSTGCLSVFDLIPYKEGFLLMAFDRNHPDCPAQKSTRKRCTAPSWNTATSMR